MFACLGAGLPGRVLGGLTGSKKKKVELEM